MPDHDYHGLLAATWDVWRGDTSTWSDRPFYRDIIDRYGQPALDIGCGTGRLLLDYLAEGLDIDGVDDSPQMLDLCRAKADRLGLVPTLYRQRIEALDLPRRYRTILAPSSVLQLVTEPGGPATVVRRLREHLEPGGALVASFAFEWRPGEPIDSGWQPLFARVRPEDGATVRASNRQWYEPAGQLWHTEQRFEVEIDGRVVAEEHHRRSPEGRWYTQDQAVELFRGAGLDDIAVFREFTREPAGAGDRLFCVLGCRPARA